MNNQDFQVICKTLRMKYENGRLRDKDVDEFADVISNILGREDLRAKDTEYEKLSKILSKNYEGNIGMNPLLARMYEICRMYEKYRRRPLTEMERKEEQMEMAAGNSNQYPVCFVCDNGKVPVMTCWFKNLNDINGSVEILESVIPELNRQLHNSSASKCNNEQMTIAAVRAFSTIEAGIDPLDKEATLLLGKYYENEDSMPINTDANKHGIMAVDKNGFERNRARRGAKIKINMSDKTVTMDCFTTYGLAFYEMLTGDKECSPLNLEQISPNNIEFSFDNADVSLKDWKTRLGDVFGIPGSPELVGTKAPLPLA